MELIHQTLVKIIKAIRGTTAGDNHPRLARIKVLVNKIQLLSRMIPSQSTTVGSHPKENSCKTMLMVVKGRDPENH